MCAPACVCDSLHVCVCMCVCVCVSLWVLPVKFEEAFFSISAWWYTLFWYARTFCLGFWASASVKIPYCVDIPVWQERTFRQCCTSDQRAVLTDELMWSGTLGYGSCKQGCGGGYFFNRFRFRTYSFRFRKQKMKNRLLTFSRMKFFAMADSPFRDLEPL